MSDNILQSVTTRVETEKKTTLVLAGGDIVQLLLAAGWALPQGVPLEVAVSVPSGGDWSNTELLVDDENPLSVSWVTKTCELSER